MKLSIKLLVWSIILTLDLAKRMQCRPVHDHNNFIPINDVNWSSLGNIIDMDELENDKSNIYSHQISSRVSDTKNTKRKRILLSEEEKAKRKKESRQRYKEKLESDPIKKENSHKRRLEVHRLWRQKRRGTITKEEQEKRRERQKVTAKAKNSGFSSKLSHDWHNLRILEANRKANEADLAKLKEYREKDRIYKYKLYHRKKAEKQLSSIHQPERSPKSKKN